MLSESEKLRRIERRFHLDFDSGRRVYRFVYLHEFAVEECLMKANPVVSAHKAVSVGLARLALRLKADLKFLQELEEEAHNGKSTD